MGVLISSDLRVVIQGITGRTGTWSARDLSAYGTQVVAGVVPGKGGTTLDAIPVFDSVEQAVDATHPSAALVYVPPQVAVDAVSEALEAGIELVVYPGDGMPVQDAIRVKRLAGDLGATLVGPNSPGILSPGSAKLGFMPSACFGPGRLGVVSKSGSLSYEVCMRLTQNLVGQSSVVGVGGDPVKGFTIRDAIDHFHDDADTDAILVLGEVGGLDEYAAAEYASKTDAKPVVAFIVGRHAPAGRKLGHAGALVRGRLDSYGAKVEALKEAGVGVALNLGDIVGLTKGALEDGA